MANKSVVFRVRRSTDLQYIEILSTYEDRPEGIFKRISGKRECAEEYSISQALKEAMSSKHDYGNKNVKLILEGDSEITGCSLAEVSVTI